MSEVWKCIRRVMSWFGLKTPAEEARAALLATGRAVPLECFTDDGWIDGDKLSAHMEAEIMQGINGALEDCGYERQNALLDRSMTRTDGKKDYKVVTYPLSSYEREHDE